MISRVDTVKALRNVAGKKMFLSRKASHKYIFSNHMTFEGAANYAKFTSELKF